jgi:Tol biopolymer transport system component
MCCSNDTTNDTNACERFFADDQTTQRRWAANSDVCYEKTAIVGNRNMQNILLALILIAFSASISPANNPQPSLSNNLEVVFVSEREGDLKVFAVNLDGSETRLVLEANRDIIFASCSPDGQYLAHVLGGSEIIVTHLSDMSSTSLFLNDRGIYEDTVWSPDGNQIAFEWIGPDGSEIYISNRDGSERIRVTHSPGYDRFPSWSPDGTKLAFASERDGLPGIFVINVDGSNEKRLTSGSFLDGSPDWSPDGTKILFTSFVRRGKPDLYTINPDGSHLTRLTGPSTFSNWGAKWSPDGSKIAFTSSRDGNPEVYVMDADGRNAVRLTNNPLLDEAACWMVQGTPTSTPEIPLQIQQQIIFPN